MVLFHVYLLNERHDLAANCTPCLMHSTSRERIRAGTAKAATAKQKEEIDRVRRAHTLDWLIALRKPLIFRFSC
jgi:hypothetical protein